MKLTVFDRRKYTEAINSLTLKKAPPYIIEAYKEGYAEVVNAYYKKKLERRLSKDYKVSLNESKKYFEIAKNLEINFIQEALKKSDVDFLKAFFQMTNLDIVSGEKLPPGAGKLIRQGMKLRGFSLKDLYKKLK